MFKIVTATDFLAESLRKRKLAAGSSDYIYFILLLNLVYLALFAVGVALEFEPGVALERSVIETYLNGFGLSLLGSSGFLEIIFNIFAKLSYPYSSSSSFDADISSLFLALLNETSF